MDGIVHTSNNCDLGPFLESTGNLTGPWNCSNFHFRWGFWKQYKKLSAKETKWTGWEATNCFSIVPILILKYGFVPVKLLGLLRNGPLTSSSLTWTKESLISFQNSLWLNPSILSTECWSTLIYTHLSIIICTEVSESYHQTLKYHYSNDYKQCKKNENDKLE